jgi:integrase
MKLNYPKVHTDKNEKVFVSFFINGKRYRIYNGKRIKSQINPNSFPSEQRKAIGNLLAAEVYNYINSGGVLETYQTNEIIIGKLSDKDYLKKALDVKQKGVYSKKYKITLQSIYNSITAIMKGEELTSNHVKTYLENYSKGVSYNSTRRHLNVIVNEAIIQGMESNPIKNIKSKKAMATLNKPYSNIVEVLTEIKAYSPNLYLCCLMTYGCLLRPHREIRELTWGDFSEDLSFINLSGSRNKSGRNRIVPVPTYIKEILVKGEPNHNIFSSKLQPLNEDYFKTLWSRFKAQSLTLKHDQTLYSFRHSGAIEIFKRTGSLTKLQKAMGHSSVNVSLTYLRGLEVADLNEDDMPMISKHIRS